MERPGFLFFMLIVSLMRPAAGFFVLWNHRKFTGKTSPFLGGNLVISKGK